MKPVRIVLLSCLCLLWNCATPPGSQRPEIILTSAARARLTRLGFSSCERVAAFAINLNEKHPWPDKTVVMNGSLNASRQPAAGVTLSDVQVQRFLDATTGASHPAPVALCFYPHHGLVFYDKSGRILGSYTICFMCSGFVPDAPRSFVSEPDYEALSGLLRELRLH